MFWRHLLSIEVCIAMHTLFPMASYGRQTPAEYSAWKYIRSFQEGYLKYQTYVDSVACVRFSQTSVNAADKSGLYEVSFEIPAENATETLTLLFVVQTRPDQYVVYMEDGEVLYKSTVAYSDYENCTIVQDSETPTNCKLFVNSGTSNDAIEECADKFPETCDSSRIDMFDPTVCG
uniref:Salivary lipocalin n=1 Tax=Ixodes ricinus TaxID=34613 RepID=A0A090XD95_IXORI